MKSVHGYVKNEYIQHDINKNKKKVSKNDDIDWECFKPLLGEMESMEYSINNYKDFHKSKPWKKDLTNSDDNQYQFSSKYIKPSSSIFPIECKENKSIQPFTGLIIQPFSEHYIENGSIPLINASNATIARCKQCQGYQSLYCKIPDHKNWKCALCLTNNILPEDYFMQDPSFYDFKNANVELRYSVFEYLVPPKYYGFETLTDNTWVFIIDNTRKSREYFRIPMLLTSLLKKILPCIEFEIKIAFVIYDIKLRILTKTINPNSKRDYDIKVTEIMDLESPAQLNSDDILFNFNAKKTENDSYDKNQENVDKLCKVLYKLFKMCSNNENEKAWKNTSFANTISLEEIIDYILETFEDNACKIILFGTTIDFSKKKDNDSHPINNFDNSKKHFVEEVKISFIEEAESKMLKKLYKKTASLDAFIFGDDISVNTIGTITDKSGGSLYYYDQPLLGNIEVNLSNKMYYQLFRLLTRFHAIKCQCKLRGSSNVNKINPIHHHGFLDSSTRLWYIPSLDAERELTYKISVSGNKNDQFDECCYFQFSLTYSDYNNYRILRIINYQVRNSVYPFEIIEAMSSEISFAVLLRSNLDNWKFQESDQFSKELRDKLIDLLVCYRKSLTKQFRTDSFIISNNLMTLPTYIFSLSHSELGSTLYKHRDFETCSALRRKIMIYPIYWLINQVWPKVYNLENFSYQIKRIENEELIIENNNDSMKNVFNGLSQCEKDIINPGTISPNFARLDQESYFLIDNGEDLIFYIHQECRYPIAQFLQQNNTDIEYWLCNDQYEDFDPRDDYENDIQNKEKIQIFKFIQLLRELKNGEYHNIICVSYGDRNENKLSRKYFVEERDEFDCKMLPTYIQKMHEEILSKI